MSTSGSGTKTYLFTIGGTHTTFNIFSNNSLTLTPITLKEISACFAGHDIGRDARKPVLGISNKVRFKPACSATETS